jgi:UPF0755 protein
LIVAIIILICTLLITTAPPINFPSNSIVVISRGASVSDITRQLSDAHIVKHSGLLQFILRVSGTSSRVQAGSYLFESPQNAIAIAHRLVMGEYGLPPVSITFPEGTTVRDISKRIFAAFPQISEQDFISEGKQYEGYLFPDTYLFQFDAAVESITNNMRANFDAKMKPLQSDIQASGHSLSDIIIMASLVEKEARTNESRKIVAGILWNRVKLKMPLQVDAVFGYIFNRDTYSPSYDDLKVDSPYNTYTHTGLPPGPICNPGLESIQAVLNPTKTNYLYYLTGSDDKMHYSITYAEHLANQRKYLQ